MKKQKSENPYIAPLKALANAMADEANGHAVGEQTGEDVYPSIEKIHEALGTLTSYELGWIKDGLKLTAIAADRINEKNTRECVTNRFAKLA